MQVSRSGYAWTDAVIAVVEQAEATGAEAPVVLVAVGGGADGLARLSRRRPIVEDVYRVVYLDSLRLDRVNTDYAVRRGGSTQPMGCRRRTACSIEYKPAS